MSAAVIRARADEHYTGSEVIDRSCDPAKVEAPLTDINPASATGATGATGMTPLMRASCDGLVDEVRLLLDSGAAVNAKRTDGFTALALAAFFGHAQVVRLLLESSADVEDKGRCETSAEMWATARGFLGISDLLREARERTITAGVTFDRKDSVTPDHVVSVSTAGPEKQIVIQREPTAHRTLPDMVDPPPITAPEFRPGVVFLARITSSWKNLTALSLAVMIICGLAAFAVFKMSRALTDDRREPARVTSELPAKSNDSVARPEQRIPEQADNQTLPSAPVDAPNTHHAANVIEASTADSNKTEATNNLESDEARQTTPPSISKNRKSDNGTKPTFANRISEPSSSRHGSVVAPTMFRSSSSYQKRGPVSANATPKRQAVVDVAPKPAPLSVESTRNRTTSSAADRAGESPNSQSTPLGVTSGKPRSKVIQWP